MQRRQLLSAAAASAAVLAAPSSWAQSAGYPNRPIKLIVPFPAGVSPDVVARLVADKLSQAMGQPVVVDNRPGGATVPGTDIVAKAAPDGHTLLITADHGNCEFMINADGSPNTAHTTNLVHLVYVAADADKFEVKDGILADVAPTLLEMLGVAQPKEMTGASLLKKKKK
jgi:tripartite-type tricarboxylate transporter receptor subunit TctC